MVENQDRQYLPEIAEQAYGIDEKSRNTSLSYPSHPAPQRMPSARSFIFTLLVLFSVAFGLGTAAFPFHNGQPGDEDQSGSGEDQVALDREDSTFAKLLSSASPDALHQLLHAYFPHTFRHGVYPSDESAVEAVHSNDAALATALVSLARRQDNGSSTTSVSTTVIVTSTTVTTTTTETSESISTSTTTPQSTSTTTGGTGGTTVTQTQKAPPGTTTTTEGTPPDTTSKAQTTTQTTHGDTTTLGTSKATLSLPVATSVVSSPPLSSTQVVSSASSLATHPSTSVDTTLSTAKSPASSASSTTEDLFTSSHTSTFVSTMPGGAVTTITTVEVVTGTLSVPTTTTSAGAGSLQTGVAVPNCRTPMIEAVVGLVIGGALLV